MPKMNNHMEDKSLHPIGGWKAQYERMMRWHERLKNCEDADKEDFLFVFFQNSYHLLEWLEKEKVAIEPVKGFRKRKNIKRCRDLCNTTKHGKLDKPSIDGSPWIFNEYKGDGLVAERVLIGEEMEDLVHIANDCVNEWREFLQAEMLL